MKCPECGVKIPEGAEKCRKCGIILKEVPQPSWRWSFKALAVIYGILIAAYLIFIIVR